jgi:hypothetical protein
MCRYADAAAATHTPLTAAARSAGLHLGQAAVFGRQVPQHLLHVSLDCVLLLQRLRAPQHQQQQWGQRACPWGWELGQAAVVPAKCSSACVCCCCGTVANASPAAAAVALRAWRARVGAVSCGRQLGHGPRAAAADLFAADCCCSSLGFDSMDGNGRQSCMSRFGVTEITTGCV